MKPLFVLLSLFTIGYVAKQLLGIDKLSIQFLGKLAMSSMLIFTGLAHFAFVEGMAAMLPEMVPFRIEIIYLTGVMEVMGAIGLLIGKYSKLAGVLLIVFLVAVLPANIYAALNHIDPTTGANDGPGPEYLYFRIPLQIFFIGWIYISAIRKPTSQHV